MEPNDLTPATTATTGKAVGVYFTPDLLTQLDQVKQDHPEYKSFGAVVRFVLTRAFNSEGGTND